MRVGFSSRSWEEYCWWQEQDPKGLSKLSTLIGECRRHPFTGTGKPEPLRQKLGGLWSRRIDHEHRLVYRVSGKGDEQVLEIHQCRYHY